MSKTRERRTEETEGEREIERERTRNRGRERERERTKEKTNRPNPFLGKPKNGTLAAQRACLKPVSWHLSCATNVPSGTLAVQRTFTTRLDPVKYVKSITRVS